MTPHQLFSRKVDHVIEFSQAFAVQAVAYAEMALALLMVGVSQNWNRYPLSFGFPPNTNQRRRSLWIVTESTPIGTSRDWRLINQYS